MASSNPKSQFHLEYLYRTIQAVIWLREGLDATLKAVELFIEHYKEHIGKSDDQESIIYKNNVWEFMHRRELFRATQLRLVSLHQRLECIHSMVRTPAFFFSPGLHSLYRQFTFVDLSAQQIYALSSLRTQHTAHRTSLQTHTLSTLMARDSFRMATLALMGALFLPTSIVATITSAVYEHKQTAGGTAKSLGVLLAVSTPLTGLLMWVYIKVLKRPQTGRSMAGGGRIGMGL